MIGRSRIIFIAIISFLLAGINSCSVGSEFSKVTRAQDLLSKGNNAFEEKDYDSAIDSYDKALEILPNQVTLLINKSAALRGRGVEQYNYSIKLAEKESKSEGIQKAGVDLIEASKVSSLAVQIIKHPLFGQIETFLNPDNIELIVLQGHSENLRVTASIVDQSRAEEAFRAISDYAAIEPANQKAMDAKLAGCKLLLESKNTERALIEYKKILEQDPEQLDAILGIGLALSQTGDLSKFDEAKSYLRRFLERAPSDHPMKKDIQQTLAYME